MPNHSMGQPGNEFDPEKDLKITPVDAAERILVPRCRPALLRVVLSAHAPSPA